jgi:hypothetical protein
MIVCVIFNGMENVKITSHSFIDPTHTLNIVSRPQAK